MWNSLYLWTAQLPLSRLLCGTTLIAEPERRPPLLEQSDRRYDSVKIDVRGFGAYKQAEQFCPSAYVGWEVRDASGAHSTQLACIHRFVDLQDRTSLTLGNLSGMACEDASDHQTHEHELELKQTLTVKPHTQNFSIYAIPRKNEPCLLAIPSSSLLAGDSRGERGPSATVTADGASLQPLKLLAQGWPVLLEALPAKNAAHFVERSEDVK
ncbi:hypothetical protein C8Q74DRAFT_1218952 [Fomes fomentarius]|nr:hypothetical protein C8Q74DRAFT_1218952 [Fomes fomentarius]